MVILTVKQIKKGHFFAGVLAYQLKRNKTEAIATKLQYSDKVNLFAV